MAKYYRLSQPCIESSIGSTSCFKSCSDLRLDILVPMSFVGIVKPYIERIFVTSDFSRILHTKFVNLTVKCI